MSAEEIMLPWPMSNHPLDRDRIAQHVASIFAEDLHAKRVASLANAAVGVLEGATLGKAHCRCQPE